MKITVLTAITGNKDELRDDFNKGNAKFIAYLDKETEDEAIMSDLWEIRRTHDIFQSPRRNAKIHKVLPHLFVDTDVSIWIDGNISMNITPEEMVDKWLADKDIAAWKHFDRDCNYDEANTCIGLSFDLPETINEQVERYKKEGYPEHNGLSECNVIARRHTPEINRLNEQWWAEICRGSCRDQISFPYVFRDKVARIEGNPRNNKDFNYVSHRTKL